MTLSDLEVNPCQTGFQWPISPNLFKITTELLLVMNRKSYIRFHLEPLSLTMSDLERSIQVTQVFNGLYLQILKITTELLLVMDKKSYLRFHLAPLSLTLSDLERSIQVTQVFIFFIFGGEICMHVPTVHNGSFAPALYGCHGWYGIGLL